MPATKEQIEIVAAHFIIAAIWADAPEGTHPRASQATCKTAFGICERFINENMRLFESAMGCRAEGYGAHPDCGGKAEAAFGHDLYLTLRGHGAGFWDREELGQRLGHELSEACDADPNRHMEPEFYRGWLYINDRAEV